MPEYEGPERRGAGFFLSRGFSVGHVISTVAVVIAGFSWAGQLEQDILRNQMTHKALVQTVQRNQEWNTSIFGEIKTMLNSISDRLDKIADRRDR